MDNAGQVVIELFYIQATATLVAIVSSVSGITSGIPTLLTSKIFGSGYYGPICGMAVSVSRFGGTAGTLLISLIYDITKDCGIIWPVRVISIAFALVTALGSMKLSRNKIAQKMGREQPGREQPS